MAVALRASSTAQAQTAATFAVTKPTGTADGDLLVAFQATSLGPGGAAPATPTGWTLLDRQAFASAADDLACFYKVAASEPASYTFNNAGAPAISPSANVRILCLSGAAALPEGITKNAGTGTAATATGRTTAAANEFLAAAFALGSNVTATVTPSGLTDLGSVGDSTSLLDVAHTIQVAAGASGNKTATISFSADWAALLVTVAGGATSLPSVGGRPGSFGGLPRVGGRR